MKVKNSKHALAILCDLLSLKGFKILRTVPMQYQRHYLIVAYHIKLGTVTFYMIFQRETFHKFGTFFGITGEAVTINRKVLDYLLKSQVTRLIYVLGDGRMYMIAPRMYDIKVRIRKWSRLLEKTGEEVCHLPLDHLIKLKD